MSGSGNRGPQEIVINNYTKLEGNGIINERECENRTRMVVGKGLRKML